MVTKTLKCPNCGSGYSTKMIKVYVFKRRICPKCKPEMMFADNKNKLHKCEKCGLEVAFDDERTLAGMGVKIRGTTLDYKVRDAKAKEGLEICQEFIPKSHVCQRCKNQRRRIEKLIIDNSTLSRKQVESLGDMEIFSIFHQFIKKRMQKQFAEQQDKKMIAKNSPVDNHKGCMG